MARPRQPIDLVKAKGKKHLTKQEYKERKEKEIQVDFKDVEAPEYLPKKLHDEFDEIAGKLLAIGIMTELDEDTLARYLLSKQNYLHYTTLLTKALNENRIVDAEKLVGMQDKAFKQCRACATDLGLTIASRCKLVLPTGNTPPPKENKFMKFQK